MHGFWKHLVPLWAQLMALWAQDLKGIVTVLTGQNVSLPCRASDGRPGNPLLIADWWWRDEEDRTSLQLTTYHVSQVTYNLDALRLFEERLAVEYQGGVRGLQDTFTLVIARARPSDRGEYTCVFTWEDGSRKVSRVQLQVLHRRDAPVMSTPASSSTQVTSSIPPDAEVSFSWILLPPGILLLPLIMLLMACKLALQKCLLAKRPAANTDIVAKFPAEATAMPQLPEPHSAAPDDTLKHYASMRPIKTKHTPPGGNTADQYIYEEMVNIA